MRIIFLAEQKRYVNNFNDYFVFFKWGKQLSKEGIQVNIKYTKDDFEKQQADLYVVSNRYKFSDTTGLKNLVNNLKQKDKKVALLDANDTSGLVNFDLINDVDFIIKKQVLKDRQAYTINNYDLSVRPWLPNMPEKKHYENYVPCPADRLHKIRVGWNIGMCDYRYFPHYLNVFRNYIVTPLPPLNIDKIIQEKKYFTTLRGRMDYGNPEISFQRNVVLTALNKLKFDDVKVGQRVKKKQFLQELQACKIGISPFGWGEVCYRDFELARYGSLLIKASMDHMDTFPNMYLDGETYVKLKWDMSDLEEKLTDIRKNYHAYTPIIKNAYQRFMTYQNDGSLFINHFKQLVADV